MAVADVQYVTFRALLDYLLTDETPDELSVPALLDLMMLANRYGVIRLEQLCVRMIGHNVSDHNAPPPDVAYCAQMIGSSDLHRVSNHLLSAAGVKGSASPCETGSPGASRSEPCRPSFFQMRPRVNTNAPSML